MNIGIVGLGLIGGTYAKTLKNHNIYAVDKSQETLTYAMENEIIAKGSTNAIDILPICDIVFICLYPEDTLSFIAKNQKHFKQHAIISDVVGIKKKLISDIMPLLRKDLDFVFAHPIAGREKIGVTHAKASIFKDANFVITPIPSNKEENITILYNLAKEMGFKNVSKISADEHDDIISFTSQLTHVIALALVNSDTLEYDTSLFIGDSYKDLTRIAMINHKLWSELFVKNKEHLLNKIKGFETYLDYYKEAIESEDYDTLYKMMKEATKIRKKIEGEKK